MLNRPTLSVPACLRPEILERRVIIFSPPAPSRHAGHQVTSSSRHRGAASTPVHLPQTDGGPPPAASTGRPPGGSPRPYLGGRALQAATQGLHPTPPQGGPRPPLQPPPGPAPQPGLPLGTGPATANRPRVRPLRRRGATWPHVARRPAPPASTRHRGTGPPRHGLRVPPGTLQPPLPLRRPPPRAIPLTTVMSHAAAGHPPANPAPAFHPPT